MIHRSSSLRFIVRTALGIAAFFVLSFAPVGGMASGAKAARVTVEFHTALQPYGKWHRHERWGEVWVPARVARDWRPYTVGHWVYSEDFGWYWVADKREARWGWVAYHYGRWVRDRHLGWAWVPGDEWAPAWVTWRRGHRHIGWAPLPPREVVVEYRDEPNVWIFVRSNDFTAPQITTVLLPLNQQPSYVRETVLVNRTVLVSGSGLTFAVNPGIEPTVISALVGQPLTTYAVRPRVLAGTATIPNAVEVQASELKQQATAKVATQEVVQQTKTTIKATSEKVPEPQPLAKNENGRLGDHPPKAAKQTAQQQKQGEQPKGKAAEQKQGEQPRGKAAEQKQGEQPRGKAAEQKQGEQPRGKAAEQKQGEQPRGRSAEQKQGQQQREQAAGQGKSRQQTEGHGGRTSESQGKKKPQH